MWWCNREKPLQIILEELQVTSHFSTHTFHTLKNTHTLSCLSGSSGNQCSQYNHGWAPYGEWHKGRVMRWFGGCKESKNWTVMNWKQLGCVGGTREKWKRRNFIAESTNQLMLPVKGPPYVAGKVELISDRTSHSAVLCENSFTRTLKTRFLSYCGSSRTSLADPSIRPYRSVQLPPNYAYFYMGNYMNIAVYGSQVGSEIGLQMQSGCTGSLRRFPT